MPAHLWLNTASHPKVGVVYTNSMISHHYFQWSQTFFYLQEDKYQGMANATAFYFDIILNPF